MERVIIGTADAVEAEYGATALVAAPFVAFLMWNDEPVSVEGFSSIAAARAEYSDAENIEYL